MLITGTRDWKDYVVTVSSFKINLGSAVLTVRVQGLNRYYALMFKSDRKTVALVKARDESRIELASVGYEREVDFAYTIAVYVKESKITGCVAGKKVLEAEDGEYTGGSIGAIIVDGSVAIDQFDLTPLEQ